jgi:hypothetical protein
MIFWVSIAVFGIPIFLTFTQLNRNKKSRELELKRIKRQLKNSQEKQLEDKINAIKNKN